MARTPGSGYAEFPLESLVLGLLTSAPKHGYQLYQDYEEHFGVIWKVGRSKFYAALAALNQAGFLAVQVEFQPVHPPRKVYQLTDSGKARFEEWLYRPVTPLRGIRVEFLAKLRFAHLLHLADIDRIVDGQIAVCEAILAKLEQQWKSKSPLSLDMELVYEFRRRQALFILEWLQLCRERFGAFA